MFDGGECMLNPSNSKTYLGKGGGDGFPEWMCLSM